MTAAASTAAVPAPPEPPVVRPVVARTVEDAAITLRSAEEDGGLPDGVCGRVLGTALRFDVVDDYGTMFAPGCAARSIAQRVKGRKLNFVLDHDRGVRSHVGTVTAMDEVGNGYALTADLFDTEDGRRAKEYVRAVLASGGSTGLSISFRPHRSEIVAVPGSKGQVERFTEIELREVTLTPFPAVPGADVLAVRREAAGLPLARISDPDDLVVEVARATLRAMTPEDRARFLAEMATDPARSRASSAATPPAGTDPARTVPATTPTGGTAAAQDKPAATMEDRLRAVRASFGPQ